MPRTSVSDPLQIAELRAGEGVLGLTFCPGKCGPSVSGAQWARDLATDIAAIKAWAPEVVVTLMETHEFAALGVANLGDEIRAANIAWLHLPIRDVDVPNARFERLWVYAGHTLRRILRRGGRVLIHCRGGLGRTGLVAARLLIEFGEPAAAAIAQVRAARPGAIETSDQERYVRDCSPVFHDEESANRILGCLFGGAIGDAFGYPVEFHRRSDIVAQFGPSGLRAPVLQNGRLVVSDDTQMTLFTAAGLLATISTDGVLDVARVIPEIRRAYLDWYRTQTEVQSRGATGLLAQASLWARRHPGITCLSALSLGGDGAPERPINDSKGCGGVMRVAPLGLLPALSSDQAFQFAAEAAALTHGHPAGWSSAAGLASLVRDILAGLRLADALRALERRLAKTPAARETATAVRAARELAAGDGQDAAAIRHLGEGWVGEEALAIGLYAALRHASLPGVLQCAANHDGDSDSTASIAGQIWGALNGVDGIPLDWVARLDVLEPLCEIAGQLISWSEAETGEQIGPRLAALADYAESLANLGAAAVTWNPAKLDGDTLVLGWPSYAPEANAFIKCAYDHGWIQPFNWPAWAQSPEGRRFWEGASAIEAASPVQLRRFLTTVVRNDRFCEGVLAESFQRGEITAVAERAHSLLSQLPQA